MDKKKKVLWISPFAPYDSVGHAGGKTHNFYIKYFQKCGFFDITLFSFCCKNEVSKIDLDKYGIAYDIDIQDETTVKTLFRIINNVESVFNPWNKYCNIFLGYTRRVLVHKIKEWARKGEKPEIVVLQWTAMIFLHPIIKEMFPECKLVAIEEDVTYLAFERRARYAKSFYWKHVYQYQYKKMKAIELDALTHMDVVVVNNPKDERLLQKEKLFNDRICRVAPFYERSDYRWRGGTKNIIFYGAMGREENYLSAIWFAENVLPRIDDQDVKFIIIGGNPHPSLNKIAEQRVKITGFVEDVREYFENCLCLVAPLVLGAGIKVKILEALDAGIPVMTNTIGIEGIPARDGREYLHCEKAEDYIEYIQQMLAGEIDTEQLSDDARKFMEQEYDIEKMLDNLIDKCNK